MDQVRQDLLDANQEMSEKGLRVLAFAVRDLDDDAMPAATDDPMAAVHDLVLVALVGIIDPLRADGRRGGARRARRRHRRPHDHRRPHRHGSGDRRPARPRPRAHHRHRSPTAQSDDEVIERLPQLHVFGRVAPEDKVRLARLMQEAGEVVAMTGDAVNDAAALKQADIGVAMGSGSEVTKQAGQDRAHRRQLRARSCAPSTSAATSTGASLPT